MTVPTSDLSAVRRVQTAIRHAVARTQLGIEQNDHDLVFIGYVETVVWACALDELLERMEPGAYAERRDGDPGGQVLRGLRWARNQGVHQLLVLHRQVGGMMLPMILPGGPSVLVWAERSQAVPNARSQPKNERPYDQFVAGNQVAATLADAQRFLWERAIPNPFVDALPWDLSWPMSAEDTLDVT